MINTAEELSACLARLNELDAKRTQGRWLSVGAEQYAGEAWLQIERLCTPTLTCRMTSEFVDATDIDTIYMAAAPDAIALANKLHAENERLKALLVECEKVVCIQHDYIIAMRGRLPDTLKQKQQQWLKVVKDARKAILAKLHAAGIGG